MITNSNNLNKIVIVGGGTAGWITASVLAKKISHKITVEVIESPDISTVGVGEATIPPIVNLLQILEIDELEFVKAVDATFKYGIHFQDWSNIGESYMHAFGLPGFNLAGVNFCKTWLAFSQQGQLKPLNSYSSTAQAAYLNKFNPPHKLPNEVSEEDFYPLSQLFYAYHFDAKLLSRFLKRYALNLGVTHNQTTVNDVVVAQSDLGQPKVTALHCQDGEKITADLFVDCSGGRGLLAKQALKVPFIDWSNEMPCDSAIAIQTERADAPEPYTHSIAMNAGWRWQIPLQSRNGNGYVYSSQYISDDEAEAELREAIGKPITEANRIKFKTGHLSKPWTSNVVAIGLSSGFFEPLESTSIHMIQKYALKLANALVTDAPLETQEEQFNDSYHQDALELKDFILLHYYLTKRTDSQFWRNCQLMAVPKTLSDNLDLYARTGDVKLSEQRLFPYESYVQILAGMKCLPSEPLLSEFNWNIENATAFFSDVELGIKGQVMNLPAHEEYLKLLK